MTAAGDFGLSLVIRELTRQGAGGFEWYKESCLLRRIEVRMRARAVTSLVAYAGLLADDPEETARLLHTLSVRVTSFFRNPDSWARLRQLLEERGVGRGGRITAWSMGCATGEEAWSLAFLLLDHARRAGGPPPETIRVIASDVDHEGLATAKAGRYPARGAEVIGALVSVLDARVDGGDFVVGPTARERVEFRHQDLTAATDLPEHCDLVCCRNVLIFLGREGQRRLLDAALRALAPAGLLVLGRTESTIALPDAGLVPVDVTHRIYRRAP